MLLFPQKIAPAVFCLHLWEPLWLPGTYMTRGLNMSIFKQVNLVIICVLLFFSLIACKTTPEEEEGVGIETTDDDESGVPVPAEQEKPSVQLAVAEPPEDFSGMDNELNAARAALRRANLMGANKYFPKEYRALVDSLNNASAGKDPVASSATLKGIVVEADKLYDRTLLARKNEYEKSYYASDKALREIEADHFAREEYDEIINMALAAVMSYEQGDLMDAEKRVREILVSQDSLYTNLNENIRYVNILMRDAENYISDAENNEAFTYAPDELKNANENYSMGYKAFESYDIEKSANLLAKAKQNAIIAARVSTVRKKQSETDALLIATQKKIESASRLRVLDNEGNIAESRPWDGDDYLGANPLVDHSRLADDVEFEEPELRNLKMRVTTPDTPGEVPKDIPLNEGEVLVNADEQYADYLKLAEEIWKKGVQARNNGQFDLARDYFRQANAYVQAHESSAIERTYTVQYRKVATDCLWRISERKDIFDNPYLWPKIWRSNRKIIQNPDLIYPGQVLVIPPK